MLFWAGNWVFARALRFDVPPVALAFWRWSIALIILTPFAYSHVRRQWRVIAGSWRVLGLLALGLLITWLIERSWMGYYLVAIGEDEDAAEAIGVNAPKMKRDIYMISAFLTALAGTFYTQYIYFIDPATAFSFSISIEAALVSIVGGIGTLWGPVIGTVLLETTSALLQSWLGSSIGGIQLTVYALILMAVILWRPTGLIGVATEAYQRYVRRHPARA